MITDPVGSNPTRTGTLTGFLLILFVNISSNDVLRTVILAIIGATVSFLFSLIWKYIVKKWKL